jgi:MFS family permease
MVASFPAMVLGGRAADRFGRRALLLVSGSLLGVGFAWLAFVGGYAALFVVLLVLSAASGVYDVGINAAAMDLERTTGRRFMAVLHAAFSAGGAAGALVSGALISVGVDFRHVYLVALIPLGAVILAVTTTRFPPKEEGATGTPEGERVGLYKNLSLLLVALIAALVFLSEGAMEHWSGIYLRGTLALPALLGASGVAVFHASMAVGRLGAAGTIRRFGDRPTLRAAGLLATGGMVLALATREPLLVVAGFLVVGLALSAVAPITFSFAGDLVPDRAGGASSVHDLRIQRLPVRTGNYRRSGGTDEPADRFGHRGRGRASDLHPLASYKRPAENREPSALMEGNRPDQEARDAFAEASDQAERLLADLENCGPLPVPWR